MLDAARAIDYLNRRAHLVESASVGIQHCDIKPHNILIVGGVAQVCDLGVARVLEDTRASAATGSAAYIAPEFIQGGKPSSSTDQYSLAVTYVELRTGALPFHARSAAAAYLVHLNSQLDYLTLSTPGGRIDRATARAPEDRFTCCVAFVRALEEACARIPTQEIALIEGVARLNASGLLAGIGSSADSQKCFGPFHTAPIDDGLGEELALSDHDETMSAFIHRSRCNSLAALIAQTATAVSPLIPPVAEAPTPADKPRTDEMSSAVIPTSDARPSTWGKSTEGIDTNISYRGDRVLLDKRPANSRRKNSGTRSRRNIGDFCGLAANSRCWPRLASSQDTRRVPIRQLKSRALKRAQRPPT